MAEDDGKPADAEGKTTKEPEPISFAEFLAGAPPSRTTNVIGALIRKGNPAGWWYELVTPQIELHCTDATCNGPRFFRYKQGDTTFSRNTQSILTYVTYLCSNCQRVEKIFSLYVSTDVPADKAKFPLAAKCYKFGEHPAYGPPTPARLIKLFGDDRDLFFKGRRCESQGLGIGAFTYYRRVIENQKNRILNEIIRVSEKIDAPTDVVATLREAKNETQFSKAVTSIKDAIPQALLIDGHNPITLLHSALSGGVHEMSDEQCLEQAHDARVVMIELADRLGQALKDEAELNAAVSRLMRAKQ
jgi:hypothetical protein